MLFEEFLKILDRDTYMYGIVDLNGDTDAVTLPNAEATVEYHFILQMIFLDGALQTLHNLGRAL